MASKTQFFGFGAILFGLGLSTSCRHKDDDKKTSTMVPTALSLAEIAETPLSLGSIDTNCEKMEHFLTQFATAHLKEVTFTIEPSFGKTCNSHSSYDNQSYRVDFTLSKEDRKALFTASIIQTLDKGIFADSKVSVNVVKDWAQELGTEELNLAPNILHLQKTMAEWSKANKQEVNIYERPYSTYIEELLAYYGEGKGGLIQIDPEVKIELIPGVESKYTGTVKFTSADPRVFEGKESNHQGRLLDCKDIDCLNDGSTYEIVGAEIRIWSKTHLVNGRMAKIGRIYGFRP